MVGLILVNQMLHLHDSTFQTQTCLKWSYSHVVIGENTTYTQNSKKLLFDHFLNFYTENASTMQNHKYEIWWLYGEVYCEILCCIDRLIQIKLIESL